MPCVGFEPTIPASERAKIVHPLDRTATVTGQVLIITIKYSAIADLHFPFTVAHSLGFPVFTSRLLATDLITETITSNPMKSS
jgi:hypothetical protein